MTGGISKDRSCRRGGRRAYGGRQVAYARTRQGMACSFYHDTGRHFLPSGRSDRVILRRRSARPLSVIWCQPHLGLSITQALVCFHEDSEFHIHMCA